MTAFSIDVATAAFTSLSKGEKVHMKEVAEMAKRAFDSKYDFTIDLYFQVISIVIYRYPGTWHVVVGKSFGSFVTHEVSRSV